MKLLLVLLASSCACAMHAVPRDALDRDWLRWMQEHSKRYLSADEHIKRKAIWSRNWGHMRTLSNQTSGFAVKLNEHSDKTLAELLRLPKKPRQTLEGLATTVGLEAQPPASWDWRTKGCIPPVHNQGQMGASSVFDIVDAAANLCCKRSSQIYSLSVQQVEDCCMIDGRLPMHDVYGCLRKNGGLCTEADYPKNSGGECHVCKGVCQVNGTHNVPVGNEDALKSAVYNAAVIVAIDASQPSFQMYNSGIYQDASCNKDRLDHAMLAVGYGTENGVDYWILKNSWGGSWGESGYIRLLRGKNMCGVAESAFGPF